MAEATAIDTQPITAPAPQVEAYLREFLEQRPLPANLRNAILYSLLGPGKRMRPILVIRCCQAVGGSLEKALPAAGAIEMIHAFSLVHDDLPAMDNDDLRRGRPTLHRHTNEAMAILAGDAMSALAFELVTTHMGRTAPAAEIVHELALATNNMVAGQIYDTLPDFPADLSPMERLRTIHRNKTEALIRCSCRMGGICGGATADQLQRLTRYGEAIGLMFQIVDDLLDITQTTEELGKTAGKDVTQAKMTCPSLLGIEESRREVERLRREAHEALEPMGSAAQALHDLCEYLSVRR